MDSATKSEKMMMLGYMTLILVMLVYAIAQLYAGFIGIRHHCGVGWAIAAIFVAFIFRFTLPLSIGSFFGAMNVWGWHWIGALVFASPGLAFMALMIPMAFASAMKSTRE